jgi:hypothetical protein
LKNIIENQLNDLCLNQPNLFEFNLNIKVNGNNQSCCLYNLAPDNKNYYFSYLITFNICAKIKKINYKLQFLSLLQFDFIWKEITQK